MTIKDVAKHLGVGWDIIKDIQKRDRVWQIFLAPSVRVSQDRQGPFTRGDPCRGIDAQVLA
jgi:hypothetical protein